MKTLAFYVFIVALVAAVAVQAQAPAGGEFRVNNATAAEQIQPAVSAGPSGSFVVAWMDGYVTPSVVKARLFDRQGAPVGGDFRVSFVTTGSAQMPSAATDARGRAVIVWHNAVSIPNPVGVFGRVYDASGAPVGSGFAVTGATAGTRPSVAFTGGGRFVVVWESYGQDGSGKGILARRFDSAGVALGPELVVNTFTTGYQARGTVAAADGGSFVVAWSGAGEGSSSGVFARRFDAFGAPVGAQLVVNSSTTGYQGRAQVAGDAQGNFVVVWQDDPAAGPPTIVGRRFAASGAPLGSEFVVHAFTTGYSFDMSVTSDRAGNFTVVWQDTDGDGLGVHGRRFTASGAARGAEFRVNVGTFAQQRQPGVATDGAGNLFVVWSSTDSGYGYDIKGRRFGGLLPSQMAVSDGGNGVVEVPEDFALITGWRNVNGAAQTFQGRAASTNVPAGLSLTLSPDANYGTVANGALGPCVGPCFSGGLVGTRPAGHADFSFVETVLPDAQGQAQRWVVHLGDSFTDVPRTSPFYRFVEALLHNGVSGGCTAAAYCPASAAARDQMAVFVLLGKEGPGYAPRACTTPVFGDVPAASPFCPWVEELVRRGVVGGCGGGNYCPASAVTREQMPVFVLRTLDPALSPPACTTPLFGDVPASSPFCRWIEELARRGVVSGCGGGNYCPSAAVTREQMAVFISGTFGLSLYGP